MEVEIIKLGSIVDALPIPGTRGQYDTSQFSTKTIQVVSGAGAIYDWYLEILKRELAGRFGFSEREREAPLERFSSRIAGNITTGWSLKGVYVSPPEVGNCFSLNLGGWRTSVVLEIIDENIIITKNSIYAIHDPQKMRDKKIRDLGI